MNAFLKKTQTVEPFMWVLEAMGEKFIEQINQESS
jgi:hypothetical protein